MPTRSKSTRPRRPTSPASPTPGGNGPRRPSRAFTIFAIAVIALMIFFLFAAVIPDLMSNRRSSDGVDLSAALTVTPGAEEARMRERLQQNPNDVNAMMILAQFLANSGKGTEAIQWYDKAIQQRPDDYDLRVAFGRTLMENGFAADAELQLQKAAELQPSNPEPVYLLGQLYQNQNPPRNDDARQKYDQVLKMAPDSSFARQAKDALSKLQSGS